MISKAIIGLGNPPKEFFQIRHDTDPETLKLFQSEQGIVCPSTTRHNAGFAVLNKLAGPSAFAHSEPLKANLATVKVGKHEVVLVQPTTFMNDSGLAAKAVLDHFGLTINDILLVYDEKDLPLGEMRFDVNCSAGGHNGVKSVMEILAAQQFDRLRFGVGPVPKGVRIIDFVLSPIETDVQPAYDKMVGHAVEAAMFWINLGLPATRNLYNRRNFLQPE